MKRELSVLMPAARLTLWKVLGISLLTAGVQVPLLLAALRGWAQSEELGPPALEVIVQQSRISLVFGAGLLLVCAVLILPGLERGAKTSYTLRRLGVGERALVMLWGGLNSMLLLIFWAVQTAAALAFSQYYFQTTLAGMANHQTLFLACSRSPYLHNLLPLWDWPYLLRNLAGGLALGLSAAALPFHWRHGRKGWSVLLLAVFFAYIPPMMMESSSFASVSILIFVIAYALITSNVWRRYGDED